MRKYFAVFILIFCNAFLCAGEPITNLTDSGDGIEIGYYLNFSEIDSTACGFSSNCVDNVQRPSLITSWPFDTVVSGITESGVSNPTVTGEGTIYAFIDIVSRSAFSAVLSISPTMTGHENTSNTLGWKCALYDSDDIESANKSNLSGGGTYNMYSSDGSKFEHICCVRLDFTTDNVVGKPLETYEGTVTLTVSGQ